MNKRDLTIIATVIITLLLMFATSLLLELEIIKAQIIRKALVYITIAIEAYFGYSAYKYNLNR